MLMKSRKSRLFCIGETKHTDHPREMIVQKYDFNRMKAIYTRLNTYIKVVEDMYVYF